MFPLFEYQKEAINFIESSGRVLLELDTGLGKTRTCIEYLKKTDSIPLIICPKFLSRTWAEEIVKWGYTGPVTIIPYSHWSSAKFDVKLTLEVLAKGTNVLILDEAHYLKSWGANRTKKILLELLGAYKFEKIIFSTATPIVKSGADLHPILATCQPGKWGKFREFCNTYCNKKWNKFKGYCGDWEYYGLNASKAGELTDKMVPFRFARKKKDVLYDLPEKIQSMVYLDIEPATLEASGISRAEALRMIDAGKCTDEISANRRVLGLSKIPDICEWMESFGGGQVVLFTWHRDVARGLCHRLNGLDIKSDVITGDMEQKDRDSTIADFKNGELKILVATIASCGAGLNLQCADTCVFAELPWSATELKQAEDRLHRIGQKNAVNVYYFVAQNSLDELVLEILKTKEESTVLIGGNI